MKTIKVDYNLQDITQRPEAHLSDLFITLYTMFLMESEGTIASRYSLNKIFPYIFDRLEKEDKIENYTLFNLPFYKFKGGHYNKSLIKVYLKSLIDAGLVKQISPSRYKLNKQAKKFIQDFSDKERGVAKNTDFEKLVLEYSKRFLKTKKYWEIYTNLRAMSHTLLVEDQKKTVTVGELKNDDNKAISYNHRYFKKGKTSNLIPKAYLTLLAYELQKNLKPTSQDLEKVKLLLSK